MSKRKPENRKLDIYMAYAPDNNAAVPSNNEGSANQEGKGDKKKKSIFKKLFGKDKKKGVGVSGEEPEVLVTSESVKDSVVVPEPKQHKQSSLLRRLSLKKPKNKDSVNSFTPSENAECISVSSKATSVTNDDTETPGSDNSKKLKRRESILNKFKSIGKKERPIVQIRRTLDKDCDSSPSIASGESPIVKPPKSVSLRRTFSALVRKHSSEKQIALEDMRNLKKTERGASTLSLTTTDETVAKIVNPQKIKKSWSVLGLGKQRKVGLDQHDLSKTTVKVTDDNLNSDQTSTTAPVSSFSVEQLSERFEHKEHPHGTINRLANALPFYAKKKVENGKMVDSHTVNTPTLYRSSSIKNLAMEKMVNMSSDDSTTTTDTDKKSASSAKCYERKINLLHKGIKAEKQLTDFKIKNAPTKENCGPTKVIPFDAEKANSIADISSINLVICPTVDVQTNEDNNGESKTLEALMINEPQVTQKPPTPPQRAQKNKSPYEMMQNMMLKRCDDYVESCPAVIINKRKASNKDLKQELRKYTFFAQDRMNEMMLKTNNHVSTEELNQGDEASEMSSAKENVHLLASIATQYRENINKNTKTVAEAPQIKRCSNNRQIQNKKLSASNTEPKANKRNKEKSKIPVTKNVLIPEKETVSEHCFNIRLTETDSVQDNYNYTYNHFSKTSNYNQCNVNTDLDNNICDITEEVCPDNEDNDSVSSLEEVEEKLKEDAIRLTFTKTLSSPSDTGSRSTKSVTPTLKLFSNFNQERKSGNSNNTGSTIDIPPNTNNVKSRIKFFETLESRALHIPSEECIKLVPSDEVEKQVPKQYCHKNTDNIVVDECPVSSENKTSEEAKMFMQSPDDSDTNLKGTIWYDKDCETAVEIFNKSEDYENEEEEIVITKESQLNLDDETSEFFRSPNNTEQEHQNYDKQVVEIQGEKITTDEFVETPLDCQVFNVGGGDPTKVDTNFGTDEPLTQSTPSQFYKQVVESEIEKVTTDDVIDTDSVKDGTNCELLTQSTPSQVNKQVVESKAEKVTTDDVIDTQLDSAKDSSNYGTDEPLMNSTPSQIDKLVVEMQNKKVTTDEFVETPLDCQVFNVEDPANLSTKFGTDEPLTRSTPSQVYVNGGDDYQEIQHNDKYLNCEVEVSHKNNVDNDRRNTVNITNFAMSYEDNIFAGSNSVVSEIITAATNESNAVYQEDKLADEESDDMTDTIVSSPSPNHIQTETFDIMPSSPLTPQQGNITLHVQQGRTETMDITRSNSNINSSNYAFQSVVNSNGEMFLETTVSSDEPSLNSN